VDVAASAGAFVAAAAVRDNHMFGNSSILVEFLALSVGIYLGISATLDVGTLGALVVATFKYSTNSSAFLAAVTDLAGGETGLGVVDKARKVINSVKVIQALDAILESLKVSQCDAFVRAQLDA
jgi:hypothetical protein